jgi:hypothetical protein
MKKFTLAILFIATTCIAYANLSTKVVWNSDKGFYEVMLMSEQSKRITAGQISLQFPSENTFPFDFQNLSNSQNSLIFAKRHYAPKECPSCDFQTVVFQNKVDLEENIWKTVFVFKITGPVKNAFIEISKYATITQQNRVVNIENKIQSIDNQLFKVEPMPEKAFIVSTTYMNPKMTQNFNVDIDYLDESLKISTNWLGAEGKISFLIYDESGILQTTKHENIEQGAQHYSFSIADLKYGKFFIKAKQGDWEMVLNDGFWKKE